VNRGFFTPIYDGVGKRVMAYKYFETGMNQAEDKVSQAFCYGYSHVLAVIIVSVVLMLLWRLVRYFVENKKERIKIVIMAIAFCMIMFAVACTFPFPIGASLDTFQNYTFAKSWQPRYWHGFLTNVVYCAEFIIVPHMLSMVLFPTLLGMGTSFVCFYRIVVRRTKLGLLWMAIWFASFLFLVPFLETYVFAGRNFMYGLTLFSVLSLLFADRLEGRKLSYRRGLWIALFGSAVINWRGEGIIWLLFIPLIILAAYKGSKTEIKKYVFTFCALILGFIITWIPSKYGNDKYQGKDYYIVNTGVSLGAVLNSENSNLSYDGVDEDIANINAYMPIEYIKVYGGQSFQMWNGSNARSTAQGGISEYDSAYLKAAYSILLHNSGIWIKERIDTLYAALGLKKPFDLITASGSLPSELIIELSEDGVANQLEWYDYEQAGYKEATERYNVDLGTIGAKINYKYQVQVVKTEKWFGIQMIVVVAIAIALLVVSLVQKEWLYFASILGLMGTIAAVFLASPGAYENYYYYSFFNLYWIVLFAIVRGINKYHGKKC
jgi:hypothetical protein